jgi:hypothetical protein
MRIREIKAIRQTIATTSTEELIATKNRLAEASTASFKVLDKDATSTSALNYITEVGLTYYKIDKELQARA